MGDKVAVLGGFPKEEYYPSTDITQDVLKDYFGAGGDLVMNSTDKYATFMERYLNLSFYDTSLKKTWIPLGCCGIFFGFGVATKWTGFYAGAGLAILFFARLITYYREYCYALQKPDEESNGVSHRCIVERFKKNTFKNRYMRSVNKFTFKIYGK